jgi:hypothetical protein
VIKPLGVTKLGDRTEPANAARMTSARRCRTVVRRPQPESEWNKLQLPSVNKFVDSQRWQVSPIYFWFDECTCTKVGNRHGRCTQAQQRSAQLHGSDWLTKRQHWDRLSQPATVAGVCCCSGESRADR